MRSRGRVNQCARRVRCSHACRQLRRAAIWLHTLAKRPACRHFSQPKLTLGEGALDTKEALRRFEASLLGEAHRRRQRHTLLRFGTRRGALLDRRREVERQAPRARWAE